MTLRLGNFLAAYAQINLSILGFLQHILVAISERFLAKKWLTTNFVRQWICQSVNRSGSVSTAKLVSSDGTNMNIQPIKIWNEISATYLKYEDC
jgi:hypothetical protein